jgi:hypothetical protein
MPDARSVAQQLAGKFLENGNYTLAGPMRATDAHRPLPAAANEQSLEVFFSEAGFAGLAVQSVGYEEGADQAKVHIYVTKGSRRDEPTLADQGDEVVIQINRMGKIFIRPEQAISATNQGKMFTHKERISCGSSCAPSGENYAGTFGAIVRKKGSRNLFILSNNHVLAACNHVPVGMPILSPSSIDARPTGRAPGEIGRHSEICELRSGEPNLVAPCREDVAIAKVTDNNRISSWQGAEDTGYDTPATVAPLSSGMRVKKVGRTTGLTAGTVEALINTPFALPYKAKHFQATVWAQDVWTVRADGGTAFALSGDSGSLVVAEDESASVGILFAASPKGEYGWIIPMTHVVTLFGGVSLVHGHGVET